MSNPNYPSYPGGAPQGGGYPQQNPAGGGYPQQQHAPAAEPVASSGSPAKASRGGGSGLGPPAGAAKLLYIGLLLLIFSFAVKQVVVDLSLNSGSGMIEKQKLAVQMSAELAEIDAALDTIDTEIADLEFSMPKAPGADAKKADTEEYQEQKTKSDDKIAKLKESRAEKDKDLEDKRKAVRKKYRPLLRDASRNEAASQASGLGKVQFLLFAKIILDILKIVGASMCILPALGIAADNEQSTGLKVYAAVIAGIALLAVILGGVNSF